MVHYPTDVIGGIICGIVAGVIAFFIVKGILKLLEKTKLSDFDLLEIIKKKKSA